MASKRSIEPLDDNNWKKWKAAIQGTLVLEGLYKSISPPKPPEQGEQPKSPTTTELESDEKTRLITRMYMTDPYLDRTEHCTTAHELWKILNDHFESKSKNSLASNVERMAMLIANPPDPQNIVLELRGIAAKIGDTKVNSDKFLVPLVAAILPPEYVDLRHAINNAKKDEEFTLDRAENMVKLESQRRDTAKARLAVQRKPTNPKFCTHCSKKGHSIETCWSKKRTDRAKDDERTSEKSDKVKVTAIKTKLCAIRRQEQHEVWYLDSGAGAHSVNTSKGFVSLDKNQRIALESANGEDIVVEGVGVYQIETKHGLRLMLKDCHYAPKLIGNFLSASRLNRHGMDILLRQDGTCIVFDGDEIVIVGHQSAGMYVMDVGGKFANGESTVIAALRPALRSLMDWHRALGHVNFNDLCRLKSYLNISRTNEPKECKSCLLAKSTRLIFGTVSDRKKAVLELIHTDLSGTLRVPSVGGISYFLTFTDDYSKYTTVYLLKTKDEVYSKFVEYKAYVENKFNTKIKALRSDNGTEYTNHRFQNLVKESGIDHQHTHVDTPQQNGISERMNRTIKNGVRSVMIESGLPMKYWPFAVKHVTQTRNVSPNSSIDFKTPYELWTGSLPDYGVFYPFGSFAVAHKRKPEHVFDERGVECRLLMNAEDKNGYVLLNVKTQDIFDSRDVRFMKETKKSSLGQNEIRFVNTLFGSDYPEGEHVSSENNVQIEQSLQDEQGLQDEQVLQGEQVLQNEAETMIQAQPSHDHTSESVQVHNPENVQMSRAEVEIPHVEQATERVEHETENVIYLTDRQQQDYLMNHPGVRLLPTGGRPRMDKSTKGRPAAAKRYRISYINPTNEILDKLNSPEGEEYRKAMDNEYYSLISKNTWTLVLPPQNAKVIKTRWILSKKNENPGIRYKARLVAKGFTQRPGVDFDETYAPVIRGSSIRLLLAHACKNNLKIHHVDVKTAYLNADLAEEIYIDQPFGYVAKTNERMVCKLNKAIYGLKQSAECWSEKLNEVMEQLEMEPFSSEECIFADKNKKIDHRCLCR